MAKFYADYYPNFSFKTFDNLIELFGLDKKKKIRGFSKGMQRQTEIVLALASKPQFLLLDETFDGLDPQKREITKKLSFNVDKISASAKDKIEKAGGSVTRTAEKKD